MDKLTKSIILFCFLVGAAYHVAIILRSSDLISDRPFRDDSFYALTVARNIADGRGLTVADGEIPTNGIQPLFVYVSAIAYLLTSDPWTALRLVQVIHLIVHALSVLLLYGLIRRLSGIERAAWIGSAIWACSYGVLTQEANGLETGFYLLMIQICVWLYTKYFIDTNGGWIRSVLFGIALGITTLARIDAGFLCLAIGFHYISTGRPLWKRAVSGPAIWMIGWFAVTLPWWLYNIGLTGSPVPTSGLVQTLYNPDIEMSIPLEMLKNFWFAIQVMLDHVVFVVYTPLRVLVSVSVVSVSILLLKAAAVILFSRHSARVWRSERFPVDPGLRGPLGYFYIFAGLLLLFYVFVFSVEWYMNRYLIPFAVATSIVVPTAMARLRLFPVRMILLACAAFTVVFGSYFYTRETDTTFTDHWGWVRDNLDEDTWVASSQAGILGYYHQRTINTDGKVNSEMFGIRRGGWGTYLSSRGVDYFIEWGSDLMFHDSTFMALYEPYDTCGRSLVYRRIDL